MSVLFVLIALSLLMGAIALAFFAWALLTEQYDDLAENASKHLDLE